MAARSGRGRRGSGGLTAEVGPLLPRLPRPPALCLAPLAASSLLGKGDASLEADPRLSRPARCELRARSCPASCPSPATPRASPLPSWNSPLLHPGPHRACLPQRVLLSPHRERGNSPMDTQPVTWRAEPRAHQQSLPSETFPPSPPPRLCSDHPRESSRLPAGHRRHQGQPDRLAVLWGQNPLLGGTCTEVSFHKGEALGSPGARLRSVRGGQCGLCGWGAGCGASIQRPPGRGPAAWRPRPGPRPPTGMAGLGGLGWKLLERLPGGGGGQAGGALLRAGGASRARAP